jgi:hypothetical protein
MAYSYSRMLGSKQQKFSVNDHLIEFENDALQIRNLVGISVGRRSIPITQPEPIFSQPPPGLEFAWKGWLVIAAIGWISMVLILKWSAFLGFIAVVGVLSYGVFKAIQAKKRAVESWGIEKNRIAELWKVWDDLRRNPPILFSLKIETNSGSRSLFYSFEQEQIDNASLAVKKAMQNKEVGDVVLNIDTIDVAGDASIENIGSTIYNQTIQSR